MYRNMQPHLDGKDTRDLHVRPIETPHPHHMTAGYASNPPHYHNGDAVYENGNTSHGSHDYHQYTSGNPSPQSCTNHSSATHQYNTAMKSGTIQPTARPVNGRGYTTTFYVQGHPHTYNVPHPRDHVAQYNNHHHHNNNPNHPHPQQVPPSTTSSEWYSAHQTPDQHQHIYQQPQASSSTIPIPPGYMTSKSVDHHSNHHIYQQPYVPLASASTLPHGYTPHQTTDPYHTAHHTYQQPHAPPASVSTSALPPTSQGVIGYSESQPSPTTVHCHGLEHESNRLASLSISDPSAHPQTSSTCPNNHQPDHDYYHQHHRHHHHQQQHPIGAYITGHTPHSISPRQIRHQNRAVSESQLYPIQDEDLIPPNGSDPTPDTTTPNSNPHHIPPMSLYNQKTFHVVPPPPPLEDSVFVGRRDVRNPKSVPEKKIVSDKGTVRGFTNRVRAGIATFWAQPEDQIFLEYNKVLQPKVVRNYRQQEKGRIVVYGTSMSVVRETSERCKVVRNILQNHMVRYEERDVYMSREMQMELKHRLHQEGIEDVKLPQVFADGIHIGGAGRLERLNEAGELRALLESYQKINVRFACDRCGGYRFVPCEVCHGSKRSLIRNHFTEEFCALRCMHCDENGLRRCEQCKDQQE